MARAPFVTVIIPVRNEAAFIERSLSAVVTQDYPASQMEILVVDGMSTDDTRSIVRAIQNNHHQRVKLLDNPNLTAPYALNVALRHAQGEIIIRVDGHCEIKSDYVSRCVSHLQNDGVEAVGGPIETIGRTLVAQIIAIAMSSPFGVGGSSFRTKKQASMLVDTVAFPAYTRHIIEKLGAFDEELVRNQDDEYNYRLRKMGGRILLAEDVRSKYYSRSSLAGLWRQYFYYGFWKVRVMQKHPRQMSLYQFVPLTLVIFLLSALVLAPVSSFARWIGLSVTAAYLAALLVVSLITFPIRRWHQVPLLSLSFVILHISYGLGFLCGLLRFWRRWGDHDQQHNEVPKPQLS